MTRKEYENRLAELQTQIDELKNTEIEDEPPTPPHPRWKPKNGEMYFYLTARGYLSKEKWFDTAPYEEIYKFGNLFLSAEDATFAAERLRVLAEMREWAGKWNDKYSIAYVNVLSGDTRIIVNDRLSTLSHGEMRFATKEDAENCIKAVGEERLKKYYFMVLEDEADDD